MGAPRASKDQVRPGFRLAVVGVGYGGMGVAASARKLGAEVGVLEREDRLLARVAGPVLSSFFQQVHEEQGVRFHFGVTVEGFEGRDGQVSRIQLAGAEPLACDAVLVGTAAVPNDDLARATGLASDDGVDVDPQARAADPGILATGDISR